MQKKAYLDWNLITKGKGVVMLCWDDLRYFLALHRHGRLIAAGKSLKVDHTTVGRRVRELESALNAKLFDKKDKGFQVTSAGASLLGYAETVESTVLGLEDKVFDGSAEIKGLVRVSSPDSFAACFLALCLPTLLKSHPGLEINLLANNSSKSLSNREIDLMITDIRPSNNRLVIRRLTEYKLGLFASRSYVEKHARIENKSDLVKHELIACPDGNELLESLSPDKSIECKQKLSFRSCNLMSQYKATQQGYGLCILPYFMINRSDDLVQILPKEIEISQTYWLASRPDIRDISRIKKVSDFIANTAYEQRASFL